MSYVTISIFTVGRLNTGYQVPKGFDFRRSRSEKMHDARHGKHFTAAAAASQEV
jgi:hypothetical protein